MIVIYMEEVLNAFSKSTLIRRQCLVPIKCLRLCDSIRHEGCCADCLMLLVIVHVDNDDFQRPYIV